MFWVQSGHPAVCQHDFQQRYQGEDVGDCTVLLYWPHVQSLWNWLNRKLADTPSSWDPSNVFKSETLKWTFIIRFLRVVIRFNERNSNILMSGHWNVTFKALHLSSYFSHALFVICRVDTQYYCHNIDNALTAVAFAGDCIWDLACSVPKPPKRAGIRVWFTGEDVFAESPAADTRSPGEFTLLFGLF